MYFVFFNKINFKDKSAQRNKKLRRVKSAIDNGTQQRQAKMPAAGATQALRLCRNPLQAIINKPEEGRVKKWK